MPASAQSDNKALAKALAGLAQALEADQQDQAITHAFQTTLRREPTESELRRSRVRMHDQHWTEEDVVDDLKGRSDYRRHSQSSSGDVDRVILRAYDDILHREPDRDGPRSARPAAFDRVALPVSLRRAYLSVLQREPDSGAEGYVQKVLKDHWTEQHVAQELRHSPEYRSKHK